MKTKQHFCEPVEPVSKTEDRIFTCGLNGPAIFQCWASRAGMFWVASDDELISRVNFCPFCGEKAPSQVEWSKSDVPQ